MSTSSRPTRYTPAVTVLRVVAAAGVAVVGYGHFYLWQNGYEHAPVDQLFLLDFGAGIVLAVLLLVGPRRLAAFLGGGFVVVTFAAYLLSRGPGVPTNNGVFTEHGFFVPTAGLHLFGANPAVTILVAEAVGALACGVLFFVGGRRPSARALPQRGARAGLQI